MVKKRPTRQENDSPLKTLRSDLGLSQEEFGRQIGVSGRTISRWEAGDSEPTFTVRQLKALDRFLRTNGKSIQDLPDDFSLKL